MASTSNANHNNKQNNNTNSSPNHYQYVHNFKYNYDITKGPSDNINEIATEYERITNITPTHFEFKDNKQLLCVTILSNKDIVHNKDILFNLSDIGINLKLTSTQIDKNSIFCVNGPAELWKEDKDLILSTINSFNDEIFAIDCYVIPSKSINQKTASFKITVATQKMASIAITKGFKILNKYINPTQLSRSKVLNTVQCSKCQDFNHGYNGCKNVKHVCPHCSLDHELKNCINKNKPALCNNCGGKHRTTSNVCPTKQKYLHVPTSFYDKDNDKIRVNPENNYYTEAPPPTQNPWFPHTSNNLQPPPNTNNQQIFPSLTNNRPPLLPTPNSNPIFPHIPHTTTSPTHNQHQLISYDQCLSMATKFVDWPFAFTELQKAFNLSPIISIPSTLHNQLKPDFSSLNPHINNHLQSSTTLSSPTPQLTSININNPIKVNNVPNKPSTNSPMLSKHSNDTATNKNLTSSSTTPLVNSNTSVISNSNSNSNTTHKIIYSLSPSINANTVPNSSSKNNYFNNKSSTPALRPQASPPTNPASDAIPKLSLAQSASSQNLTNPSSSPIPNSQEADDPAPLSSSPSNASNTSNESIDILRNSDTDTITTPLKTSPIRIMPKLINKSSNPKSPISPNSMDALSPIERKAIKILRSRTRYNKTSNLKFKSKNSKKSPNNNSSNHD